MFDQSESKWKFGDKLGKSATVILRELSQEAGNPITKQDLVNEGLVSSRWVLDRSIREIRKKWVGELVETNGKTVRLKLVGEEEP